MLIWVVLVTGVVFGIAANDWRKGLLALLIIGVLQDVFRKLTPEVPSYYLLWSIAAYAFVVLLALVGRSVPRLSNLHLRSASLRSMMAVFLLLIALQLINSLIRYGNPVVITMGSIFYLGPLVAMLVGVGFVDSTARIKQFLGIYLIIFIPACLTVFLSPVFDAQFPVLRDVGTFLGRELVIYDMGTILESHPGLFRVGEIAAWHAATCIVFLSIYSLTSHSSLARVIYAALMILLVGVIVLTGRRKMLLALTIFFSFQWGLLVWYRWEIRKVSAMLLTVGVAAAFAMVSYQPSQEASNYLQRSQTVYGSLANRLESTLELAQSAAEVSQGVGLGAGVTAPGVNRNVVGIKKEAGWASESGLGKIIIEIGILGLLVLFALVAIAGRQIIKRIVDVRGMGPTILIYQLSFIAYLLANLAAFSVASQLFADLFILIMMGTMAGFVIRIHNAAVDERMRVLSLSQG